MGDLTNKLQMHDWRLNLRLGVSDAERSKVQPVSLDIGVTFKPGQPAACMSDNLADTVSYSSILKNLQPKLEAKEWHLLEHVAYFVLQELMTLVPKHLAASFRVKVTKLQPPVAGLNAASFECQADV